MIPVALFQIRDPEMRAEYYERLREQRNPKPTPPPTDPSVYAGLCKGLKLEEEIECLAIYDPQTLTPERLQLLKDKLDTLLKGKGGSSGGGMQPMEPSVQTNYDDGDGLNLNFTN